MIETIGWIGSICFAMSGLPQAIKSHKDGHSNGISWGLLILWLIGEICCLIYVIPAKQLPLICNYVLNLAFLAVILKYKVRPNNESPS